MQLENRGEILEAYEEVIESLTDISELDAQQEHLQSEIEIIVEMIRKLIGENTQAVMEQAEYERKYNGYCPQYEEGNKRFAEISELRMERTAKRAKIRICMDRIGRQKNLVTEFDQELWYSMVDYVTVYEGKSMVFTFRDGRKAEVPEEIWKAA